MHRSWHTCVDAVERKAEESVGSIGDKRGRDLLGKLNYLPRNSGLANSNCVGSDTSACSRSVGIRDIPGISGLGLVGAALRRGIVAVAGSLAGGQKRRKDPAGNIISTIRSLQGKVYEQISTSSIKVQV